MGILRAAIVTLTLASGISGARHVTTGFVQTLPRATPAFVGSGSCTNIAHYSVASMSHSSLLPNALPTALGSTKEMVEPPPPPSFNIDKNAGIILLVTAAIVLLNLATVNSTMMRGWTPDEIACRIPLDTWNGYTYFLTTSPIQTKAITSATVYTIGDIVSQRAEGTEMDNLDLPRITRSLIAGLLFHGPLSHVWYNFSEGLFDNVSWGTAWWVFLPKIILDQATWGPFWNNFYILVLGTMKRESIESIWNDMKRTTIPLVVSGLKLWPLAHCITYGVVPVENRLLWVDFVEIFWVAILATEASNSGVVGHGDNESNVELATEKI